MATVTTWTGRDANALRYALRMSMTGFAEHLGAARRTVAKWSSQGDKVLPRADMQAALDTVLSRATPEARNASRPCVRWAPAVQLRVPHGRVPAGMRILAMAETATRILGVTCDGEPSYAE